MAQGTGRREAVACETTECRGSVRWITRCEVGLSQGENANSMVGAPERGKRVLDPEEFEEPEAMEA